MDDRVEEGQKPLINGYPIFGIEVTETIVGLLLDLVSLEALGNHALDIEVAEVSPGDVLNQILVGQGVVEGFIIILKIVIDLGYDISCHGFVLESRVFVEVVSVEVRICVVGGGYISLMRWEKSAQRLSMLREPLRCWPA